VGITAEGREPLIVTRPKEVLVSIRFPRPVLQLLVWLCWPLAAVACVFVNYSKGVEVKPVDKNARTYEVRSPVKAHLIDGSTVVYDDGIVVTSSAIVARKQARRYGVLNETLPVTTIPLDSVIGLESFHPVTNVPASYVLSAFTAAGSAILDIGAAVLIFGSCPTIYADSAGTSVLQAEVFARRISPLLEARDIDLLHLPPATAGVLMLEVRNEALETHYINHFELLDVRHPRGTRVIPDEHGHPLVVDGFMALASAQDRAHRDLRQTLARADGDVFRTDGATLDRATGEDPADYIDVVVPRPNADSAVVALRLRNSLLNTVLLYDLMLAAPGARSIDWLAQDMRSIGPMVKFGRWYRKNFGLRVSVWDGRQFREIERHPTYGPVAWRDVATVVPVPQMDSLRVRFSFTADEWRIDWIGVAGLVSRPRPRLVPVTRVRASNDSVAAIAQRNLRWADERYVQTAPGERFWISFDTGPEPLDSERSFLLASQGYYSEWVRGSWVKAARETRTFEPSADALDKTLRRWSAERDSVDKAFYATRIPMRTP
jgi:hypothetical protein